MRSSLLITGLLQPVLSVRRGFRIYCCILLATLLSACGGGAETEAQPRTNPPVISDYSGPAPEFPDVQAFRVSLWENIRVSSRCGQCHVAGGQAPLFARSDDVNLAYAAANLLVDRDNPGQSRLVTKVASGHNCWESTTTACVDTMTRWIENWVGSSSSGGR
jgi:hypothetical protein